MKNVADEAFSQLVGLLVGTRVALTMSWTGEHFSKSTNFHYCTFQQWSFINEQDSVST